MKNRILILGAAALFGLTCFAQEEAPAFPGAEGHGRYTTGGRGGEVRHVTNLNDSGKGSLREAVKDNNKKTVVFDVSGYIDLTKDLTIGANTTIAGQTAPGDGITLRYYTIRPNGNNIIIRFIRARRSQVKNVNDGADAMWCRNFNNIIIDHCSLSWCIDEIGSFYDNRDFTLQWSALTEALANPGHSKGAHSYGGIWGGKNASFHHNFLAHMQNRAPRFNGARYNWNGYDKTKYINSVDGERVDFRNCLMYNWGSGGCYGGPGGGYINMVNNYYKAGPGTSNKTRVTQVSKSDSNNGGSNPFPDYTSRYFIEGNYMESNDRENWDWNGVVYDSGIPVLNGVRYTKANNRLYGDDKEYIQIGGVDCIKIALDEPVDAGTVTTHTALEAYENILDYVGASLARDGVDIRNIEEARTGTTTFNGDQSTLPSGKTISPVNRKGIVDFINDPSKEENTKTPSFPILKEESRPANWDTDGDGIPDTWETANGLNPNDASDGKAYTIDIEKKWYTNLECYLNSIVEPIVKAQNEYALEKVDEYFPIVKATSSAIDEISADMGTPVKVEYFSLDGRLLTEPAQGISIRRLTYADGTVETDKVLK